MPLYLGAPDIQDFIPPDTFIDLREFRDYAEVERFLDSLDAASVSQYVAAAAEFLHSPAFDRFSQERFARRNGRRPAQRARGLIQGGDDRIRTGDNGFADRCLATWLRRRAREFEFYPKTNRAA